MTTKAEMKRQQQEDEIKMLNIRKDSTEEEKKNAKKELKKLFKKCGYISLNDSTNDDGSFMKYCSIKFEKRCPMFYKICELLQMTDWDYNVEEYDSDIGRCVYYKQIWIDSIEKDKEYFKGIFDCGLTSL